MCIDSSIRIGQHTADDIEHDITGVQKLKVHYLYMICHEYIEKKPFFKRF